MTGPWIGLAASRIPLGTWDWKLLVLAVLDALERDTLAVAIRSGYQLSLTITRWWDISASETIWLDNDCLAGLAVSSSPSTLLAVVEYRTGPPKMDHTPDIRNINPHPKRVGGHKDFTYAATEPFQDPSTISLLGKEALIA
ncbi:hypothetical protein N7472_001560 [Penicillium cf. griseofulvum]|uniref:Uncharacterized protein n=1 Tax=Penicillium cf. griseofulvum TaxID=2972120 RepID=A0A9W9N1I2_9EURO|nr:hypothetical protein N7472_001560 [Penicillium cf. griseofulvum]